MSQSLECPQCHSRTESHHSSGWSSRCCPHCGAPMVLAAAPAEALVLKYLRQQGAPPQRAAGRHLWWPIRPL